MFLIEVKEEGAQRRQYPYVIRLASIPVRDSCIHCNEGTERLRVSSVVLVADPKDDQPVAVIHAARY